MSYIIFLKILKKWRDSSVFFFTIVPIEFSRPSSLARHCTIVSCHQFLHRSQLYRFLLRRSATFGSSLRHFILFVFVFQPESLCSQMSTPSSFCHYACLCSSFHLLVNLFLCIRHFFNLICPCFFFFFCLDNTIDLV